MDAIYSTSATAHGGRNGRITTSSGRLEFEAATPPELGGDPANADKTNPEELFAAGYAACFHSALQLVAAKREVDMTGSTVTCTAGLGGDDVHLVAALEVSIPSVDREMAQKLAERAHAVCPYSRATRGNVDVELSVVDAAQV
jgi:osmotically inducible protein OsmC